jgi:tryptophan synthase alpha chain
VIVGSALVSALGDGDIAKVRGLTEELADGVRQRIPA